MAKSGRASRPTSGGSSPERGGINLAAPSGWERFRHLESPKLPQTQPNLQSLYRGETLSPDQRKNIQQGIDVWNGPKNPTKHDQTGDFDAWMLHGGVDRIGAAANKSQEISEGEKLNLLAEWLTHLNNQAEYARIHPGSRINFDRQTEINAAKIGLAAGEHPPKLMADIDAHDAIGVLGGQLTAGHPEITTDPATGGPRDPASPISRILRSLNGLDDATATSADIAMQKQRLENAIDRGLFAPNDHGPDALLDQLNGLQNAYRAREAGAAAAAAAGIMPPVMVGTGAGAHPEGMIDYKPRWTRDFLFDEHGNPRTRDQQIVWVRSKAQNIEGFHITSLQEGGWGPHSDTIGALYYAQEAIRDHLGMSWWMELNYRAQIMGVSQAWREAKEISELNQTAGKNNAEAFDVLFKLKIRRSETHEIIAGVAEAMRILGGRMLHDEVHGEKGGYARVRKDNKETYLIYLTWLLNGCSPNEAGARAFDKTNPFYDEDLRHIPNFWAMKQAENLAIMFGLPAIASVKDGARNERAEKDLICYPMFRLMDLQNSLKGNAAIAEFFRTNGRSLFSNDVVMGFMEWLANQNSAQNLIKAGRLENNTTYVFPKDLWGLGSGDWGNIPYEQIPWIQLMYNPDFNKWTAYLLNQDMERQMGEAGGAMVNPSMETLAAMVDKKLYEKLTPDERARVLCEKTKMIVEANREKGLPFFRTSELKKRGSNKTPWTRRMIGIEIHKLNSQRFNVPKDNTHFKDLCAYYGIKP